MPEGRHLFQSVALSAFTPDMTDHEAIITTPAAWITALPGLHAVHAAGLDEASAVLSPTTMDLVRSILEYAATLTPPLTAPVSYAMFLRQPDSDYDMDLGLEMRFRTADPTHRRELTVILSDATSSAWVCLERLWKGPFASALDVICPWLQEVAAGGDVQ